MKLDFVADPSLAERWSVINADTGEEIEDLAWADSDTGVWATIKKRPRTMNDPPKADLRIRSDNGNFALTIHHGEIEFVDRAVNPFKAELLGLLDDPDVVTKLRQILSS